MLPVGEESNIQPLRHPQILAVKFLKNSQGLIHHGKTLPGHLAQICEDFTQENVVNPLPTEPLPALEGGFNPKSVPFQRDHSNPSGALLLWESIP